MIKAGFYCEEAFIRVNIIQSIVYIPRGSLRAKDCTDLILIPPAVDQGTGWCQPEVMVDFRRKKTISHFKQ